VSDIQTGHEKTITGLLPALAGANLIYGLGMLEMGVTFSFSQLVIDSEFARMIKYAVNGLAVNDETLAVDVIHDIGIGKRFLEHEATFKHMRTQSTPELIDRSMREDWTKKGASDMVQRAREKAIHILETHQPDPLPDRIVTALDDIIETAENERVGAK
jgi:trimethylamine--corrinoid protein Co-methyltransferase